jgi:hypothetical protein
MFLGFPDPLDKGTNPRIRIRTKMSRIPNIHFTNIEQTTLDGGGGTDLGAESARPGDPVEVGVRVLRHVVVEHDVHALDVHATAEQVRRHQDTLLEVLELLVPAMFGSVITTTLMLTFYQ